MDGHGTPLGLTLSAANRHDSKMLAPTLDAVPPVRSGMRDAELLLAAEAVRAGGRPAAVGGDLSAAAWSTITGLMQRIGGMPDPRVDRDLFLTFPTWVPAPLRFPIDHALFTPEFRLRAVEVLPDIGSDHLPLQARLCHVPGDAGTPAVAPPTEAERRRAWDAIENGREDAARGGGVP